MFPRPLKGILLLLCCWLLAGPQLLLQLGAWTWMLASYSQESTIEQAFRETFGGERPCELCKIIRAVDKSEKEAPSPLNSSNKRELNLMLGLARQILLPAPRASQALKPQLVLKPTSHRAPVPTPPPRAA